MGEIQMKFWLCLQGTPADELVQSARDAEALGYEGVWLPEHLVVKDGERTPHPTGYPLQTDEEFPDPFLVFAAMSAVTTRLRFMTYVYVVPLRNVFSLTKHAATLALLSGNRFVLGTGVGWLPEEFDTVGEEWSTRGRRFDEMLDIMRDFWDDGYAEYHGTYFDFPRSGMFPVPTQQVPLWIGGHSGPAAQRAARFDGYMPMDGLHDRTRAEFTAIDAYRRKNGLAGAYERVIVAPIGADADEIRRLEVEEGITTVTVAPFFALGEPPPQTRDDRYALAARYMEEIIAKV
jgi:probable F420-dependent oxidoreductase